MQVRRVWGAWASPCISRAALSTVSSPISCARSAVPHQRSQRTPSMLRVSLRTQQLLVLSNNMNICRVVTLLPATALVASPSTEPSLPMRTSPSSTLDQVTHFNITPLLLTCHLQSALPGTDCKHRQTYTCAAQVEVYHFAVQEFCPWLTLVPTQTDPSSSFALQKWVAAACVHLPCMADSLCALSHMGRMAQSAMILCGLRCADLGVHATADWLAGRQARGVWVSHEGHGCR